MAVMRTAAKISRQPIGKWDMGGNKMIAITACAAALAAVTEGLLLRSGYEKKHFVTDQYEIESPKLPDGAAFRCVFLSDLHDNVYGTDNEPLVAAIRAFKPDAVLIGGGQAKEQAQTLLEYGVDKVYVYAHEALAHFRGDVYTNIMEDCIKTVKPTVILVGATSLGRSLAPACATRFRTGLTADCTVLDMKENTDLVQIRPAFGGNIMAQIITTNTRPQFATVRYKVMNVAEKTEPNGEVVTCEVTDEMLKSGMEVISTEIVEKIKGIEEEDVLVVAGRGVKKQEDLGLLQELADALGGQLATTRPLVEKGWNDVTKQIGLSGRTVKPKLIITCGVSGAVQFAAGMDGAECIVAINIDAEAPIFKIANYCITEDLYRVVPALTAAVRAKQQ